MVGEGRQRGEATGRGGVGTSSSRERTIRSGEGTIRSCVAGRGREGMCREAPSRGARTAGEASSVGSGEWEMNEYNVFKTSKQYKIYNIKSCQFD